MKLARSAARRLRINSTDMPPNLGGRGRELSLGPKFRRVPGVELGRGASMMRRPISFKKCVTVVEMS